LKRGTELRDLIFRRGEHDTISGNPGNDMLYGGEGVGVL
jgi:hypothetical protein